MFNIKKMRDKYKFKLIRRGEQKRLEKIFVDFQKEYWELCKKYNAQWMPISVQEGDVIRLRMKMHSYFPGTVDVPQKGLDEIIEKIQKQEQVSPPQGNGKPEPVQANA